MSLAGYWETDFFKRFSLLVFLGLFFVFFTFCGLPSSNLYLLLKLFNIAVPFAFFLRNITLLLGLPSVIVVRVDLRLCLFDSINYRGALIGCVVYVVRSGAPILLAESYNLRIDKVKGVGCLFKHILSVKT